MSPEDLIKGKQLALQCVQLKEQLLRVGLLKSGHAMESVVDTIGWELAEHVEKQRVKAAEKEERQ